MVKVKTSIGNIIDIYKRKPFLYINGKPSLSSKISQTLSIVTYITMIYLFIEHAVERAGENSYTWTQYERVDQNTT